MDIVSGTRKVKHTYHTYKLHLLHDVSSMHSPRLLAHFILILLLIILL